MTVTLKPKTEIMVPASIRRKAGIKHGDRVEFFHTAGTITIAVKARADEYTLERVMRLIEEANENPMSAREVEAANARLMAYGAQQAKKVGIKEGDIPRVIHESGSRRRVS